MWGYIGAKRNRTNTNRVPSLYVRVYRFTSNSPHINRGSLIICEGISPWHRPFWTSYRFPHYMWGYIERFPGFRVLLIVPSLYVRVYRMVGKFRKRMNCSLIICEGISPQPIFQVAHQAFPHYMWGYIEYIKSLTWETSVPSLYVRVYRQPSITLLNLSRSLIICEGISYTRNAGGTETAFPHYMWGYIEIGNGILQASKNINVVDDSIPQIA